MTRLEFLYGVARASTGGFGFLHPVLYSQWMSPYWGEKIGRCRLPTALSACHGCSGCPAVWLSVTGSSAPRMVDVDEESGVAVCHLV